MKGFVDSYEVKRLLELDQIDYIGVYMNLSSWVSHICSGNSNESTLPYFLHFNDYYHK